MGDRKSFIEDNEQIWKELFRIRDRLKRLSNSDKLNTISTAINFTLICGLIIYQVVIYAKYFD